MDEWDERGGMCRWVMVFQMQRNAGSEDQGRARLRKILLLIPLVPDLEEEEKKQRGFGLTGT